MKNLIVLLCLLSVCASEATAQYTEQRGSIYGLFGIGELKDFRDPASSGMGMVGFAYPSISSANGANPALWGFPTVSMASGGFTVREIDARSSGDNMINSAMEFTQLNLLFPIKRAKLGISASLYPISNRLFATEQPITINTFAGEVNALAENFQTGGLNAAEIGVGYRINDTWAVGYAPSFVFGVFKEAVLTSFDNSTALSLGLTEYHMNNSAIGFQHKFGTYAEKKNIFKTDDRIAMGATVTLPTNVTGKRYQETYTRFSNFTDDFDASRFRTEEYLGTGSIDLPLNLGFGLNYTFPSNFTIATEVLYQQWSSYRNTFYNDIATFNDRYRVALGGQYFYAQGFSYLSQFIYRFGLSYDTGYFQVNNQAISAWALHAGVGIPSKYTGSSLDLVIQYGQRGTLSGNLIRESFLTVGVSINMSELMFYRPKLQ